MAVIFAANIELADESHLNIRANTMTATNLATTTSTPAQTTAIASFLQIANLTIGGGGEFASAGSSLSVVANQLVANMAQVTAAITTAVVYVQETSVFIGPGARFSVSSNEFAFAGMFYGTTIDSVVFILHCVLSLTEGSISVDGNQFSGSPTFMGSTAYPAALLVLSTTLTGSNSVSRRPLLSIDENVVNMSVSTAVFATPSLLLCVELTWTSTGVNGSLGLSIRNNSVSIAIRDAAASLTSVNAYFFEFENTPFTVTGGDISITDNNFTVDVALQQPSTTRAVNVFFHRFYAAATFKQGATCRLQRNTMQVTIARASPTVAFEVYLYALVLGGALSLGDGSVVDVSGNTLIVATPCGFPSQAVTDSSFAGSLLSFTKDP